MRIDDDGNILSWDPDSKEHKPIAKENIAGMDSILNSLRDSNQDRKMWDKLAGSTPHELGYNDFYHKDSK